jgi:hypothetical protein
VFSPAQPSLGEMDPSIPAEAYEGINSVLPVKFCDNWLHDMVAF